jgi:hypothetical protein
VTVQLSPTVSQAPVRLALEWFEGDEVNLAWVVADNDWSGDYTAAVELAQGGTVQLELIATYSDPDTAFTVTLPPELSADIPAGAHRWTATTGTLHRFAGAVTVIAR